MARKNSALADFIEILVHIIIFVFSLTIWFLQLLVKLISGSIQITASAIAFFMQKSSEKKNRNASLTDKNEKTRLNSNKNASLPSFLQTKAQKPTKTKTADFSEYKPFFYEQQRKPKDSDLQFEDPDYSWETHCEYCGELLEDCECDHQRESREDIGLYDYDDEPNDTHNNRNGQTGFDKFRSF